MGSSPSVLQIHGLSGLKRVKQTHIERFRPWQRHRDWTERLRGRHTLEKDLETKK